MFGLLLGAAAAEALSKWDGGCAPRGSGLIPSLPVLGSGGIIPGKFVKI